VHKDIIFCQRPVIVKSPIFFFSFEESYDCDNGSNSCLFNEEYHRFSVVDLHCVWGEAEIYFYIKITEKGQGEKNKYIFLI